MPEFSFDQPNLTTEQVITLLSKGSVDEVVGLLPWGSNYTFLVTVCDDEHTGLAVYKPQRGERPLWDFPQGTLCQREVAAFLLSEALGWGIVPPTVLREGPEGLGSLQWFVMHNPDENYFTFGPEYVEQLQRIALFDHMINNADRKGGHCLLDEHGHIWAIDHGVCFSPQPKLRSVIWDFAGDPIPAHLLADLDALCSELERAHPPHPLTEYLNEQEYTALQQRVSQLVEEGTYPHPSSGRHYPWPPV